MSDPFDTVREALKRIESALNLSDLPARLSTEFYDAAMDSLADARAALAEIERERDELEAALREIAVRERTKRAEDGEI